MSWHPIETAPKDGTPVDVWVVVEIADTRHEGREPDAWFKDGEWVADGYGPWGDGEGPIWGVATHWMPIPGGPDQPTPKTTRADE